MEKEKKLGFVFTEYPQLFGKSNAFVTENLLKETFENYFSRLSENDIDFLFKGTEKWSFKIKNKNYNCNRIILECFDYYTHNFIYMNNKTFDYYKHNIEELNHVFQNVFNPFPVNVIFIEEDNCFLVEIKEIMASIIKNRTKNFRLDFIRNNNLIYKTVKKYFFYVLKENIEEKIKNFFEYEASDKIKKIQESLLSDNLKLYVDFCLNSHDFAKFCFASDDIITVHLSSLCSFVSEVEIIGIFKDIFSPTFVDLMDENNGFEFCLVIKNVKENLKN